MYKVVLFYLLLLFLLFVLRVAFTVVANRPLWLYVLSSSIASQNYRIQAYFLIFYFLYYFFTFSLVNDRLTSCCMLYFFWFPCLLYSLMQVTEAGDYGLVEP